VIPPIRDRSGLEALKRIEALRSAVEAALPTFENARDQLIVAFRESVKALALDNDPSVGQTNRKTKEEERQSQG
jgi:hypothetical protein